jgi:uncharacterized SAM-binding protein YcdF (DUF218 family)
MRYLVRNLIGLLATPMMVMLVLLIVALVLRWRGHRRASLATAIAGIAVLYLSALGPVSAALLRPLENAYPALDDTHLPQGIAGIAVLGAGFVQREDAPITAQLTESALKRVAEGVRLAKHYGNVRLVLSGGAPEGYGFASSARGYAIFAREMGIDAASIVMLDQPLDTRAEAQALAKIFGESPFLLVTSAYHMKRAMLLFEGTGAHPIAAPTDQRAGPSVGIGRGWVPRSRNLASTEAAIHEYLGLLAISAGQS